MPAFVKDESRWEKAKSAAAKQTDVGSESYWKLSNYIYHKMGKSEEDKKQAKLLKSDLYKSAFGGMLQLKEPSMPKSPMKTGEISVKMPKAKKMADPFGKPSLFFKGEESHIKHPSIRKLKAFLSNRTTSGIAKK